MTSSSYSHKPHGYLGVETGATRTTVLKIDDQGREEFRATYGPANLRMISDESLQDLFAIIKLQTGEVSAVAIGMAGLRTLDDKNRVTRLAGLVWPKTPVLAVSDMDVALKSAGHWRDHSEALVVLLSGTGSCAYGVNREGRKVKVGGRGHILGDQGSAFDIALKALRAVVYQYDLHESLPKLGQAMLRVLQLNHPDDLITWSQEASKQDIAHLAITVFEESSKEDALAQSIINEASTSLSDMALHCAERLVDKGGRVQFLLTGGTLLKQSSLAAQVSQRILESWPHGKVDLLERESVWGAVALARELISFESGGAAALVIPPPIERISAENWDALADSPTERRNSRSLHLDTMSLDDAIKLMIDENVSAVAAIAAQQDDLKWLIEQTIQAFQSGGRLFYAGAGTSGRLGVLDASECPPTFRAPAEQVQGIIAGGQKALWSAVEGAEDLYHDGASAIRHRGVRQGDILLGIASSGRTPFVWGAIAEAKKAGALTCLLCFNPGIQMKDQEAPDRIIAVDTGPEVLTGSTRLKAGTATKVILNTLTTLAMTHTGKVVSNLMVDLNPSNDKLRHRAIRIVRDVTGCDKADAVRALEKSGWFVKKACQFIEHEQLTA
ncbi:hypothetical protein BH11VER1_BH11VER1_34420 [soil metagenome]